MTVISFVTPWYGPDVPGGAEAETRRTAQHLAAAGLEVEVLTTCTRDLYADWGRNYHKPGLTTIDGVVVRRFPVLERDRQAFDAVNWRLMNNLPVTGEQSRTYIEEMIRSPELLAFIRDNAAERLYIFIPYLFATTYYGAQAAPERSIMIPCLHDESYARLPQYREVIPNVSALVLHTQAERVLADELFPAANGQLREVIGEGVDLVPPGDAERFRRKYGIDGPIVLYAGRREIGKNTPLLVDYWARYWRDEARQRGTTLVLIGPGEVAISPAAATGIRDLGFVPVEDKQDAFAAADVFCLPSVNESFSLAMMESWLQGTPNLVHAECAVTVEHCRRSNGGLFFGNYPEFAATLNYLFDHPATAAQMGHLGRGYVTANFAWETIIPRYLALFEKVLDS